MESRKNYYKILQVDPSADPDMIQAAYQILKRKQQSTSESPAGKDIASRDFPQPDEVEEAYNVLSDPQQRARYDQDRLSTVAEAGKEQQGPGSQSPSSEPSPAVQPPPKMSRYMRKVQEEQRNTGTTSAPSTSETKKGPPLTIYLLIIIVLFVVAISLTNTGLLFPSPTQSMPGKSTSQDTSENLCNVYDFGSHTIPCTPDPRSPLKGEIAGKIMLVDRGSDIEKAYQLIFPGLERVWLLRDITTGKLEVVYFTLQGDTSVHAAYPGKELPENIDSLYREILSDQQVFIKDRQAWFAQRAPTTTPSP